MAGVKLRGPSSSPNFSGITIPPWVIIPVIGIVVLILYYFFFGSVSTGQHASADVINDATSFSPTALVSTPKPTASPKPTPLFSVPPNPAIPPGTENQLTMNDVAGNAPGARNVSAPPANVPPPPTAPPTMSPAAIASQRRDAEADAAVNAPPSLMAVVPAASPQSVRKPPSAGPCDHDLWLMPGTIISASLYTSVDSSTNNGLLVAFLDGNLYDSSQKCLIAPDKAKLIGNFGGSSFTVSQGATHLPATFHYILLDDRVIDLGSQQAVDPTGTTGLGASVDHHTRDAIKNLAIVTAVGAILNRGSGCGSNCGVAYSGGSSTGGAAVQAAQGMLPHTDAHDTLHVSEAAGFDVMVSDPIRVKEWRP